MLGNFILAAFEALWNIYIKLCFEGLVYFCNYLRSQKSEVRRNAHCNVTTGTRCNENKILVSAAITVYAFSRTGAAKKWPLRGSLLADVSVVARL